MTGDNVDPDEMWISGTALIGLEMLLQHHTAQLLTRDNYSNLFEKLGGNVTY